MQDLFTLEIEFSNNANEESKNDRMREEFQFSTHNELILLQLKPHKQDSSFISVEFSFECGFDSAALPKQRNTQ